MSVEQEERQALERIVELIRSSTDPVSALRVALISADVGGAVRKTTELERVKRDLFAIADAISQVAAMGDGAAQSFCQVAAQTNGGNVNGEGIGQLFRIMAQRHQEIFRIANASFKRGEAPTIVFGRFPLSEEQVAEAFARFQRMRQEQGPEAEQAAFRMMIAGLIEEPTEAPEKSASAS